MIKKQHYVPQFLLRNFRATERGQIYVFDKAQGSDRLQNITDVAHENHFYNVRSGNESESFEPVLAAIDSAVAPIVRKLVDGDAVRQLTRDEWIWLAAFVGVQILRVPQQRANLYDLDAQLLAELERRFGVDNIAKELREQLTGFSKTDAAYASVQAIRTVARELIDILLTRKWLVMRGSDETELVIGDNPVVRHNDVVPADDGGMGIAVEGIQIYLPLSPWTTLFVLCPTMEELLFKSHLIAGDLKEAARCTSGNISLKDRNVSFFLNSLQIANAERFVFARTCNFSWAREILRRAPALKKGPRSQVVKPPRVVTQ